MIIQNSHPQVDSSGKIVFGTYYNLMVVDLGGALHCNLRLTTRGEVQTPLITSTGTYVSSTYGEVFLVDISTCSILQKIKIAGKANRDVYLLKNGLIAVAGYDLDQATRDQYNIPPDTGAVVFLDASTLAVKKVFPLSAGDRLEGKVSAQHQSGSVVFYGLNWEDRIHTALF